MSAMPEIGSKISLISKADIRYEGKLFTVDPTECTIALASVRSFGTEDRPTQFQVPAQSQVYDYILFRGSDIKDISIVNTQQLPNDPAILSGMAPNVNQSNYQPHGFNHPVIPSVNQYSTYNQMAPGMGRAMPKQQMPSELVPDPQTQPPMVQAPVSGPAPAPVINIPVNKDPTDVSVLELLTGSRSSTPGLLSRKSPTMDASVQCNTPHREDKGPNQRVIGQQQMNREGRHSRGERGYQDGYYRQQNIDRHEYRPRDQNRRDIYQHQGGQGLPQRNQGQGMGNNRGWTRVNNANGGPPRPRGRGNRQQGPQQGFNRGPGGIQQNQHLQKKNLLKFEEEYDFDKANTEFEEEYKLLRNQMSKIKLNENETTEPVVKLNGEEKKDDSGNETGVGECEHEEEPVEIFYDKTKSFFDNISCEAVERSKGRSQRTDWRTERKLNSETFGVALARRGNYRGRGGYYNRGMFRGGYSMNRGGYNRGQGLRQPPVKPNHMLQQAAQAK